MNDILVEVDYKKYQWEVCADFKVITILLELQADNTKYSFSCVSGKPRQRHPLFYETLAPQTIISTWNEKCYT